MIDIIFIFSIISYIFISHKIEFWTSIRKLDGLSGKSEVPSYFIKYKNLYKLIRNILFLIALGLSFFLEKIPISLALTVLIVYGFVSERYINKKLRKQKEKIEKKFNITF